MKNKTIFRLFGGLFVVGCVMSPAAVDAAPVSGVVDAMGSSITGEKSVKKAEPVSAVKTILQAEKPAKEETESTESIEEFNTELENRIAQNEVPEELRDNASAGISLAVADIISGGAVSEEETEAAAEEIAGELAVAENTEAEGAAGEAEGAVEAEAAEEASDDPEAGRAGAETGAALSPQGAAAEVIASVQEENERIEAAEEAERQEFANIGIATVTDSVNVRTEPNTDSEIAGKLYSNNACEILETTEDGGWYKIKSGDLEGYVSAEFVSVGDVDLIKSAAKRIATVHTETLFVRQQPSQDTDIIGMVPDGERLTVCDETFVNDWGWVGVSIEEGTGYVSMEFVDLSTEYTYGETKEAEEARLKKEEEERRAAEEAAAAKAAEAAAQASGGSSSSSASASGGTTAPGGSGGSSVANFALQFVGNPYVYGGSSLTNGTDCSGFVMSVYGNFGVGLPHSSSALRGVGYGVDPSAMSPGDIVCYSGHVGIYIGGGQIVHASTAATGIKVSSAYYRDILAVRRIF